MKLTFLGATGTVTGSKYLLTLDTHNGSKKILIDCGLFQGLKELRLRNWEEFPVNPAEIDAVILTHAHIDHSGYLPLLVKNGFRGKIYSTIGTKDLCAILLPDSAHLQEEEAAFANKVHSSKHHPALPLYTQVDAIKALEHFHEIPYETPFTLFDNLTVNFSRAGHIIGSSFITLKYNGKTIVFTGDIGRLHDYVMRPPVFIKNTDFLIMESTYGDREHNKEHPCKYLAEIINQTVKRGGAIIIPVFAVGRAQNLMYYIYLLKKEKKIPDIPVYLDSPMAANVTNLLHKHREEHQLPAEICNEVCRIATYTNDTEDSKKIDQYKKPMIVLSASGMATGGRVIHHLKTFAPDARNTILFTGYQAVGTRGEKILHGAPTIKIFGEFVPIHAKIESLNNVSAHADALEILEWLSHFEISPKKVFITHGEPEAARALKYKVESKYGWHCITPEYLQTAELE